MYLIAFHVFFYSESSMKGALAFMRLNEVTAVRVVLDYLAVVIVLPLKTKIYIFSRLKVALHAPPPPFSLWRLTLLLFLFPFGNIFARISREGGTGEAVANLLPYSFCDLRLSAAIDPFVACRFCIECIVHASEYSPRLSKLDHSYSLYSKLNQFYIRYGSLFRAP